MDITRSRGDKREHQDMRRRGFQELNEIGETEEMPNFTSNEFRMFRVLLRVLSLWRPRTACVLERFVYPVLVNLTLLFIGPTRNIIRAAAKPTWLSIQSMYIIHETGIWLGHILGNYYFRSRDLEENVLPRQQENGCDESTAGTTKALKRRLKYLKGAMILSLVIFSVMLCTVHVAPHFIKYQGTKRFSAELPHIHGPVDYVLYFIAVVIIIYDLGIGLALAWTLGLLYVCYASRLKGLEGVFLRWRKSTNDAIYFFHSFYSRPVKRSWKRISWWFLAHNIIALAIPLYGYELAQALCGSTYQSKHLPQFICYLIFVLTIWLAPTIMSEQIKRSEKKFQENVNNFCLGLLRETGDDESPLTIANGVLETADHHSSGSSRVGIDGDTTDTYTFASRGKELRDFLCFLEKRTPGLVARGYSLQLNLSVVSLFMGIVSFFVEYNNNVKDSFLNVAGVSNTTLY